MSTNIIIGKVRYEYRYCRNGGMESLTYANSCYANYNLSYRTVPVAFHARFSEIVKKNSISHISKKKYYRTVRTYVVRYRLNKKCNVTTVRKYVIPCDYVDNYFFLILNVFYSSWTKNLVLRSIFSFFKKRICFKWCFYHSQQKCFEK